jgi:hypothetical protein
MWIPGSMTVLAAQSLYENRETEKITLESQTWLTRIESRVFSSSSLESIEIPLNVEILGLWCFCYCSSLSSILFESNSGLIWIKLRAFSCSSLQSIGIPRVVRLIDNSAFIGCELSSISIEAGHDRFMIENDFLTDVVDYQLSRNFSSSCQIGIMITIEIIGSSCFSCCDSLSAVSSESNSRLPRRKSRAFSFSSFQLPDILQSVEIVGSSCFYSCQSLWSISFESNSQLTPVKWKAFSCSSVWSIKIPRAIQFIDGSALIRSKLHFISIEAAHDRFAIENDFLIKIVDHQLVRKFSRSLHIDIVVTIEIVGSLSFYSCKSLSSISFESSSRLTRIEWTTLSCSSVQLIEIPRNVEIVWSSCFWRCGCLLSISFESDPRVTRSEWGIFSFHHLSPLKFHEM